MRFTAKVVAQGGLRAPGARANDEAGPKGERHGWCESSNHPVRFPRDTASKSRCDMGNQQEVVARAESNHRHEDFQDTRLRIFLRLFAV